VRLTEKCVPDPTGPFPPTARTAIAEETRAALQASHFQFAPGGKIVASGGAFTVVRAILAHRQGVKDKAAWPAEIRRADLQALLNEIAPLHAAERARIERLTPERADIMPAALTTILTLLEVAGVDRVFHSWNNLRFGVAARFFAQLRGQI
jgi:exopolyphosphatase/guanosine-5'-triphosphate,3'-diphosphate pyrophosphatase